MVKLTDALLGEHGAFRAFLAELEEIASYAEDVSLIEVTMAILATEINRHATLEEELLFPALKSHPDANDLLTEMYTEHRDIQSGLESIEDARNLDEAIEAAQDSLEAVRKHFENEEEVLYVFAEKVLDEETLTRLGEDWAAARSVTV